ncbi:glycosyltransferase family 4 protein [Spirulina sp. 06S082]|uniref:glycosyltransferase family 4 protein n=1 Tax=Spirulina sp. 06S082 TaxID=3110248 RepID=UPI002B1EF646|nr:glycosyltransferase family 4 protein [Spirulina sp. 06S082]MEA5467588.1 glycosyltransferase family 4 protein [Spirulina sp. 06S082]
MNKEAKKLQLLFASTPVGALGSGLGGGVELTLKNFAEELQRRGHQIKIIAPKDSRLQGFPVKEIEGSLQIAAQTQKRDNPIILPENSVLEQMWDYARTVQDRFDLIVNFAYDWLPFYLTPFFTCPIAHLVSMGSLTTAMDRAIAETWRVFPETLAFYSRAQAETFPEIVNPRCLSSAIALEKYQFCEQPDNTLAWVARISPEKALEDAVLASQKTGIPLQIFGKIDRQDYWQQIQDRYPNAPIEHQGFLSTEELQAQLGKCRALLMTPRWTEAFGNAAIEALACGVPIIAYKRGGLVEIVREGRTGFLVEPDSVEGLIAAIERIDECDRAACRQQAEREYSLQALGDRLEAWLYDIVEARRTT